MIQRTSNLPAIVMIVFISAGFFGLHLTLDPEYPKTTSSYTSLFAGLIMVPSLSGIVCPCMYTLHNEVK